MANVLHIVISVLQQPDMFTPDMQYLSLVTATDRYSLSTKLTGNISGKLSSIFSVFLPSELKWPSCISWWNHVYIQYGRLNQNMPYLSHILPASAKFHKIPRKHTNSTERGKFRGLARNSVFCGKLWSIVIEALCLYLSGAVAVVGRGSWWQIR